MLTSAVSTVPGIKSGVCHSTIEVKIISLPLLNIMKSRNVSGIIRWRHGSSLRNAYFKSPEETEEVGRPTPHVAKFVIEMIQNNDKIFKEIHKIV